MLIQKSHESGLRDLLGPSVSVPLTSLLHHQCRPTVLQGLLNLDVEVDQFGLPSEMTNEKILETFGILGQRYVNEWAGIPRDQEIQLPTGNTVSNGKAVGCINITSMDGVISAEMRGIPYFLMLAAKELRQGVSFLGDSLPVSFEDSFVFGHSNMGPGLAGGSVAVLVEHNGRRILVCQIKGDHVLNGAQVHPFCFGGGLTQSELHLGLVQLELGVWREYLQEGGARDTFDIGRTIAIVDEGNPAEFRSFNHVLQSKHGRPLTLQEVIGEVMIPYAQRRKLDKTPKDLEVRGWHCLDIDDPRLINTPQGLYSTGTSYVIDADKQGERVLREVVECRRMVEPVCGILAEFLINGSGYRNLLLEEARLI